MSKGREYDGDTTLSDPVPSVGPWVYDTHAGNLGAGAPAFQSSVRSSLACASTESWISTISGPTLSPCARVRGMLSARHGRRARAVAHRLLVVLHVRGIAEREGSRLPAAANDSLRALHLVHGEHRHHLQGVEASAIRMVHPADGEAGRAQEQPRSACTFGLSLSMLSLITPAMRTTEARGLQVGVLRSM